MSTTTDDTPDASESDNQLANHLVDAINRPRQASIEDRGADGWLPTLDLPGFGDRYDDCGDEIPHFCEDCGHTFAVGRTCKRSTCPRCGAAWVLDRAPNIVGKLDSTARMMSSARDEPVYKHHVVFSPPDDWFLEAEDVLDRSFGVIKELLKLMDAEGAVFYHPWAGADGVGDDRGEWKRRLFNDRDWDDVRSELKPRGHFHAVVASPHIPGGETIAEVNRRTDWVIKRVTKRDDSGRSLADLEDVARAVTYCMSHTGIDTERDGNNQAEYRYFGSTLHKATVYDDIQEAADRAVRQVAPKTLGIPSKAVRCEREVAPEDQKGSSVDVLQELADDGSGSEPEAETVDDGDDVDLVPCSGRVLDIEKAPEFLENPEWVASASKAEKLRHAWEQWQAGDGWPGG